MAKSKKSNRGVITGDRNFTRSAGYDNYTYCYYFNKLREIGMSLFEWEGLPKNCDSAFLERTLLHNGHILFFIDDVLGAVALPATLDGTQDVYDIPTVRRAYAPNGYRATRGKHDSVIIFNNFLYKSSIGDITIFAEQLYDLHAIMRNHLYLSRISGIITCDEEQLLSYKNLMEKWDGNQPLLFGKKGLDLENIDLLSFGGQNTFYPDKIYQIKQMVWNEAMTCLGVPNVNVVKKERLNEAEVERNMGATDASLFTRLAMREKAAEEINAMFGLNISVRYRSSSHQRQYEDYKETGGYNE